MKLATKILSLLLLAACATFYMSCKGDDGDGQSVKQVQFNKLVGTWNLVSASDINGPRDDFDNVSVTFSGTFSESEDASWPWSISGTLPNPSPWSKQGGTWAFGSNPVKDLIRDPDSQDNEIDMEYDVSDTQLFIEFVVPDGSSWPGGRTESVVGEWSFTFERAQ